MKPLKTVLKALEFGLACLAGAIMLMILAKVLPILPFAWLSMYRVLGLIP